MKTYYITDATIFSKANDVADALNRGEKIRNDDANLMFVKESYCGKDRLLVRSAFFPDLPDNWYRIYDVHWDNASAIVSLMDAAVERALQNSMEKNQSLTY